MMLRAIGNKNLKCRAAPQKVIKKAIEQNKKIEQEKQPPTRKSFTHTMLRCCVLALTGQGQKTAIYAPRRSSRRASRAHFYCMAAYSLPLETAYFNNLRFWPIDRLQTDMGR
jgi:hypothetical protein